MNCFIIMPYDNDFDDVYQTIKSSLDGIHEVQAGVCARLDENRPAGRITDRLLAALHDADYCIADLTGHRPNIMWEVGYAMALGKPLVFITQGGIQDIPFDIKDMECLIYDRLHLSRTLGEQLKQRVIDTIDEIKNNPQSSELVRSIRGSSVQGVEEELKELKGMVGQLFTVLGPAVPQTGSDSAEKVTQHELTRFEGAWINRETDTHMYIRVINDQLVAPYCFGHNDELTGAYYDWSKAGDYWFVRYSWVSEDISGFAFVKPVTNDLITGFWWMSEDSTDVPDAPDMSWEYWALENNKSGVPLRLERVADEDVPIWAEEYFQQSSIK